MSELTNGRTSERANKGTEGRTDERTNERMNGRTDEGKNGPHAVFLIILIAK